MAFVGVGLFGGIALLSHSLNELKGQRDLAGLVSKSDDLLLRVQLDKEEDFNYQGVHYRVRYTALESLDVEGLVKVDICQNASKAEGFRPVYSYVALK